MKKAYLIAILILIGTSAEAREKDSLMVMFWNLENFFDYTDSGTGDSDKESYTAKEPRDKAVKNFKIRYCSKLEDMTTDSYRIKYRGHYYDIVSIDNLVEADSLLIIKAQREKDHE